MTDKDLAVRQTEAWRKFARENAVMDHGAARAVVG